MRRKIAALLCAVLCITAFTGCSTTELGFLKMGAEMFSTAKSADVSGSVKIDLDADEMKTFATTLAMQSGMDAETAKYIGENTITVSGKKSTTIDYTMSMNTDTFDYKMTFKVNYEGKSYDLGDMYFSLSKGYYVSGKTLAGIIQLAATTDMASEYPTELITELTTALNATPYVQLMSPQDMGISEDDMSALAPDTNFKDIYNAAIKLYEDAFSGFTSGLVTKTNNGYKIEADGQAVATLLLSVLDYVGKNPDTVLNAVKEYMTTITKAMNMPQQEELDIYMDGMDNLANEFSSMTTSLEALLAMPATQTVLDAFKYDATISKSGSAYTSTENISIKNGTKSVLTVTSKSTMTASSATIVPPTTSLTIDALSEKLLPIVEKYNETSSISVSWDTDSNGVGYVYSLTTLPFANGLNGEIDYLNEDGRIYLPLRTISEELGATVAWDNTTRGATVTYNDKTVAMDGMLQDGTSYIKFRDFEKLGFIVTYENYDGFKTATISK